MTIVTPATPTLARCRVRQSQDTQQQVLCGMYGTAGMRDAARKVCGASATNNRKCCRDGGDDDGTARVNYIAANLSYEDKSYELSDKK